MKRLKILCLIADFIVFVFPGCRTLDIKDPRVVIIDDGLRIGLSVTDIKTTPHYGGFMEVQVTGKNHMSVYKKLEYRIEWLNQNGMLIPSVMSGWTGFPAYQNTEFRFKAVAPAMSAQDFRIIIREKKN